MNDELLREIAFHPEATIEIRSADDDNNKQIEDIRYFQKNKFDIILVAPNEADAITPIIEEVYNSGIPIVIFDRKINSEAYTALQGADDASIGKAAAYYAFNRLGSEIKVLEIQGLAGSTPAIDRNSGFQKLGKQYGFTTLASEHGNWDYKDAARITDSLLNIYKDVDLIFAHNDRMAIAASDMARKHSVSPMVIGIDAVPEVGVKAVSDSIIDATFVYPSEGDRLITTTMAILEGEPYDRITILPPSSPVDRSNVDLIMFQNNALDESAGKINLLKTELDDYWSEHSSQTYLFKIVIAFVIFLCLFIFLLLRTFWQRKRYHDEILRQNKLLEEQRDTEKKLNSQLNEATQSKLMFFTNVSHDLRTPLTLIAEPVAQLNEADNLDSRQKKLIGIANRNVLILKRLINQILDFRKYESGELSLHLSEAEVYPVISEWAESFVELAKKHHIKFNTSLDFPQDFSLAIDVEKIERVFFNLMANAFKYTPDHGSVTLKCGLEGDNFIISVKDNGKGISAVDIPNIFDRFYQVDKVHPKGSGIGLSLAKAFVEMHDGDITLESELGIGTEFIVKIPVRHTSGTPSSSFERYVSTEDVESELLESDLGNMVDDNDRPLLLVIDDNLDIRQLVGEIMCDDYNIIFATNGKEAIRMASKYIPDLIVCDVMMPEMDGLECCSFIKGEVSTSHIPILMLTACSLDEQRISGYENGADGYISKPFSSQLLRTRCKNLLDNRRRIYDIMSTDGNITPPSRKEKIQRGVHDMENEFCSRFMAKVREKMSDPELNVDVLASDMGLGRSQLYRKIKALTNCSPVEIIRDLRLKKARELLTSTEMTISEIAYQVGFSTPAYFTRCYREIYNETPSEFRDKITEKRFS